MSEAAERAPQVRRHSGVELRKSLHVRFIENGPIPGNRRRTVVAPGEGRIDDLALHHERRAVAGVERQILLGSALRITEQRWVPVDAADERPGVGIEE